MEHASNHQSACMCEHNPTRAERSEQCVQSVSSSTFEPAVCCDKPFLEMLSINLAGARSEGRFCRFRGNTEAFYRNMVYHRHPRPGIYIAVLRSDRFGTGTASVYKMRLRADPYRSQITHDSGPHTDVSEAPVGTPQFPSPLGGGRTEAYPVGPALSLA